jgi:hypothetical protein
MENIMAKFTFKIEYYDGRSFIMGDWNTITDFNTDRRYEMLDLMRDLLPEGTIATSGFCAKGGQTENATEFEFPGWPERPPVKLTNDMMGTLDGFNFGDEDDN